MDVNRICSGTHAIAASNGSHVAFVKNQSLIKTNLNATWQQQLATLAPPVASSISFIRWSQDGSQLLLAHSTGLLVLGSEAGGERVRLSNGAGSPGRITFADFIGAHHVLVAWEFGKTKLFHMNTGRVLELADLKTTGEGLAWQARPGNATPSVFALLSRTSAGDQLSFHFPSLTQALASIKLPTLDAQSLRWSPDGRWLSITDVPYATPSLYIYTPDGHLYRSYPSDKQEDIKLGIKSMAWSLDSQILALATYDGRVELLNTKTFTLLAIIEHNTTNNQQSIAVEDRAPIWLEAVSASGERSYSLQTQPVSPPLSKMRVDSEPKDLGIAELTFSSDGRYLATRDCRMLNTVWLWNMTSLAAHTVVIQHTNVRSLQWHPSRDATLMIDCGEGFVHIFDVSSTDPPSILPTQMRPKAAISWMNTAADAKPAVLVTEKTRFGPIFSEGRDDTGEDTPRATSLQEHAPFEEDNSEDSLFEVLSGRKPLPPKTEPSYTEMVDLDMEVEDAIDGAALEDTFREKKRQTAVQTEQPIDVDPFDDSQIF